MGCDDPVSLIAPGKSMETDIINISERGHLLSVFQEVVKLSRLAWQLVYDEASGNTFSLMHLYMYVFMTSAVFGENKYFEYLTCSFGEIHFCSLPETSQ